MKQRTDALDTQREEIKDTICTMRRELANTIYDLESVYFRSLSSWSYTIDLLYEVFFLYIV